MQYVYVKAINMQSIGHQNRLEPTWFKMATVYICIHIYIYMFCIPICLLACVCHFFAQSWFGHIPMSHTSHTLYTAMQSRRWVVFKFMRPHCLIEVLRMSAHIHEGLGTSRTMAFATRTWWSALFMNIYGIYYIYIYIYRIFIVTVICGLSWYIHIYYMN